MKHGQTELLYLEDSYLKEFEAYVLSVKGRGVLLNATIFHPVGVGLVSDAGILQHSKGTSTVKEVSMEEEGVLHLLNGEPRGRRSC